MKRPPSALYPSRRVSLLAVCLIAGQVLTACAGRPGPETLSSVTLTDFEPKRVETLYSVTTRNRSEPGKNVFGFDKTLEPNYARFDISIPPNHKPANIEWPKRKTVDPRTDFAVLSQAVLQREDLLQAVRAPKAAVPVVFVHGYNYNFQEALYRLAQLNTDSSVDGIPIVFSWPSFAALPAYVADKEAAAYSRDALARLMADLVTARKGEVDVFAHSMGGWLTVEALRQLKLEGRTDVLNRLRVIMAAPDIDADVFTAQLDVIGRMHIPIVILVAADDRALQVSSLLGAGTQRVGALDVRDPDVAAAAKKAGVTIVDISSLESADATNHNRFFDVKQLSSALSKPAASASLGDAGAFVFDAAARTISSPFSLAATVLRQR
ncbi:alpha/beta hydrolase [Rhizobium glycinendophyticum]|uniref:Alpha/beta fold hydrolase n=1 Tax=Rhizobium glycinendophyticum TaxID=2589807 RepID=A0A504U744_9HYPH|nr:alpha/beta fold hydrolase [Rhizobium glycinendophyticum]TPP10269.1 alpha/beta fold hydrolase [Rhizobium glycinendophyticum]